MNRGILVLTLLALASCGEDGPTEPDVPDVPDVLPTANIVREGGGAWVNCGLSVCDFIGDARNSGLGCANTVRGVVIFLDAASAQLGPSMSWQISPASSVFRPGELFTFGVQNVSRSIVDVTVATNMEFSWTDVAC